MNLEKIMPGMTIKNYPELCESLDEPVLNGASKRAQLKKWERYFDYEKQGHKFNIKEVYASPLPEDFSSDDVYTKYIQTILTKYFKTTKSGEFTKTQLLKLCGFVNENWNNIGLLHEYVENEDITYARAMYYLSQLRCHVYSYCTKALFRCLNRLYKRGFLWWNRILYIWDDDGRRTATEAEVRKYLDTAMLVRRELGIAYINLYNSDRYYKRLDALLMEKFGWQATQEMIQIIFAESFVDDMIRESEEEYREALLGVNGHCVQQMYKYVDVDIENDLKKLVDKSNNNIDIEIARLCYAEEQEKWRRRMVDRYIDIKQSEMFDGDFRHTL